MEWCGARNGRRCDQRRRRRARPATLWTRVTSSASCELQRRHDRRQPPRRHRLAAPGRPHHQHVVAAGRRHLERALQRAVAPHLREVLVAVGGSAASTRADPAARPPAGRRPRGSAPARARVSTGHDLDAARPATPRRVRARHDEPAHPARRGGVRHRDRAPHRAAPSRRAPARRRTRGVASARPAPGPRRPAARRRARGRTPGPALRRSAGARFTVMRRSGNSKPELTSAARTRSRDSCTAASPQARRS